MDTYEPEIVVALSGPKRSGKDTMADIMCDEFGFERIAFADPVKAAAAELFGLTKEQLHGNLKETIDPLYGVTPREIMQKLGTEFGRSFNPDIYVHVIKKRIMERRMKRVVITDARFPNEAALAKVFKNGIVVKIERDTNRTDAASQHVSEQLFDQICGDITVENRGDLHTYQGNVRGVVAKLLEKS